jgi:hypothetical protein
MARDDAPRGTASFQFELCERLGQRMRLIWCWLHDGASPPPSTPSNFATLPFPVHQFNQKRRRDSCSEFVFVLGFVTPVRYLLPFMSQ